MLQLAILLNRSGIMETVSMLAAITFNLFLFLSTLNVADSKEDHYRSISSATNIVGILPVISVFIFAVVGIVLCGFCTKGKRNDPESGTENANSPDYDVLDRGFKWSDAGGKTSILDGTEDADIYDCVNETTETIRQSPDARNQKESRANDVSLDKTKMVYNVAYQSVDSVDDSDIYDQVTLDVGKGEINVNGERRINIKKPVRKSLSEPISSSLPCNYSGEFSGHDEDTASGSIGSMQRRQTSPIDSKTKNSIGKAMTLHFGTSPNTPLASLPEEEYDVVNWTDEKSEDYSSDSKVRPVVKEKCQTLGPNLRRPPVDNGAFVLELTKVQKMRGVADNKGRTLPQLGRQKENIRALENNPSTDDETASQAVETENVPFTCQSDNDDVTSLNSASNCSEKSDSDSFDTDLSSNTEDDSNLYDNEQLDVTMATPQAAELELEGSNPEKRKHTYENVDAGTDCITEGLEEDEDTATYGNLGENRNLLCEATSETGFPSVSQEAGTLLDKAVHVEDSGKIYATFRYEDAKVDLKRRSTRVKKAAVIQEEKDEDNDEIFYPVPEKTEDKDSASQTFQEEEKERLDERTANFGRIDSQSQRRPHKIFTNDSFLRIEEAIAMHQALNNNPAERVPVFCRRWRVQRFSL